MQSQLFLGRVSKDSTSSVIIQQKKISSFYNRLLRSSENAKQLSCFTSHIEPTQRACAEKKETVNKEEEKRL